MLLTSESSLALYGYLVRWREEEQPGCGNGDWGWGGLDLQEGEGIAWTGEGSRAPAFVTFCFLTVDAMWPASEEPEDSKDSVPLSTWFASLGFLERNLRTWK